MYFSCAVTIQCHTKTIFYCIVLSRRVGILSAKEPPMEELDQLAINVKNLGAPCEILSSDDIKKKFPAFKHDNWLGTFEPMSGFILANQALQAIQVITDRGFGVCSCGVGSFLCCVIVHKAIAMLW